MTPVDIGETVGSAVGLQSNPFMMLTFIAAPAILTNASALLAMSTSNRFARAIDMAKVLAKQIESAVDSTPEMLQNLVDEFTIAETRGLLLLKALRCFYLSISCFAMVALFSLLGSAGSLLRSQVVETVFFYLVPLIGIIAVGGIVFGVILLLREIRMVINMLHKRINEVRQRIEE